MHRDRKWLGQCRDADVEAVGDWAHRVGGREVELARTHRRDLGRHDRERQPGSGPRRTVRVDRCGTTRTRRTTVAHRRRASPVDHWVTSAPDCGDPARPLVPGDRPWRHPAFDAPSAGRCRRSRSTRSGRAPRPARARRGRHRGRERARSIDHGGAHRRASRLRFAAVLAHRWSNATLIVPVSPCRAMRRTRRASRRGELVGEHVADVDAARRRPSRGSARSRACGRRRPPRRRRRWSR